MSASRFIIIHRVDDSPREITPYRVEGNILGGDDQSPPAIAHAWREAGGFVRPHSLTPFRVQEGPE